MSVQALGAPMFHAADGQGRCGARTYAKSHEHAILHSRAPSATACTHVLGHSPCMPRPRPPSHPPSRVLPPRGVCDCRRARRAGAVLKPGRGGGQTAPGA